MVGEDSSDSRFMQQAFEDAVALVEAAREHIISGAGRAAVAGIEPSARMLVTQEMSRLTARATAAVSLLLLHKALEAGQDVAVDDVPGRVSELFDQIVNVRHPAGSDARLIPDEVRLLLDRGEDLFARMPRVHRLVVGKMEAAGL